MTIEQVVKYVKSNMPVCRRIERMNRYMCESCLRYLGSLTVSRMREKVVLVIKMANRARHLPEQAFNFKI